MIICSVLTAAAVMAIGTLICTSDDGDYAASALAQMNMMQKKMV